MSAATQFYIATLLVYLGVDIIAVWGLNLQFGVAGVMNFAFILFQAIGAYTAAILTLGPASQNGGYQAYVGGGHFSYPLSVLAAGLASAIAALVIGGVVLRRLRGDYEAIVLLVISIIATGVASTDVGLVNGPPGLSLIPQPLVTSLNASPLTYDWFYVGLTAAICFVVYLLVKRITGSPLGRALRAVRENEDAAAAVGKNTGRLRLLVFVVGGGIAGVSGAVLVQFISSWAPGSWLYPETFTLLTAIIVGGAGNNFGVMVGALCVPIIFLEAPRFLPQVGRLGLIDALQWIAVGLLALLFLWFRPQGLIPERKRRFSSASSRGAPATPASDARASHNEKSTPRTTTAEGSLLVLDNVRREFGGVTAVDGVSFDVPAGGITGVIGPNGAGKSTLVNLISGFLKPSAGSIRFADHEIGGRPPHVIARHGVIRTFQLSSEFRRLTVLENLVVAGRGQHGEGFWGALLPRRVWAGEQRATVDRARQLLSDFHLADKEDAYAGELSGGERRLVEIARAVMAEPTLLLLDEPTSGVQPAMVRRLERHLQALKEQGVTIVVIEHELDVLERLCDSVVVMARGTVLARGTMAEVRKKREVMEAYVVG